MQSSLVRRIAAVALVASTLGVTAGPAGAAQTHPGADGPANFDARASERPTRVAAGTVRARATLETALGEDADVRTVAATGAVSYVGSPVDLLTGPAKGDAVDIVLDYVHEHGDVFGLGKDDVRALQLVARSTSPDGITHVRFNQVLDGIESFDSGIEGHVTRDGRLINVSGGAVPGAELSGTRPKLGAVDSLGEARDAVDGSGLPSAVDATERGESRATTFTSGETAQLRWLATADGPKLVWQVIVDGANDSMFNTLVDATDGDVLVRTGLSHDAGLVQYYRADPDLTPVVTGMTMPAAWYDQHAGGARLWGQYARTYDDWAKLNPAAGSEGAAPQVASSGGGGGAPDWMFTRSTTFPGATPCPPTGCSWNSSDVATRDTNFRQAATNAHVLASRYHDHLAGGTIGFDEASGNFQRVNTSGSGLGDDYVRVEVNDGNGYNNANMSTPPDGQAPRMQMYLWTTKDANGSDSADIIYHEYGHGLSNRLVVNASGGSDLTAWQSTMMGEAWSDFYGLDLLVHERAVPNAGIVGDVRVGTHVTATANGIRTQGIDCPVGPTAENGCKMTTYNGTAITGGFTYGDLTSIYANVPNQNISPHAGSEIFAQTLWQLRETVGRDAALALITGGMRLAGAAPSMLDMRDAILQQAIAMRSEPGAVDDYYDEVWSVFANRGMGASATTPNANAFTATEAFDVPVATLTSAGTPAVSDPYPGGDADGIIEPGEQVTVSPVLRAVGMSAITGIIGSASTTSEASIDRSAATWPSLIRGQVAEPTQPFLVRLPTASCAVGFPVAISVTSSAGPVSTSVVIDSRPARVSMVTIADGPGAETKATTEVPFVVDGTGTITDLDLRIDELRHSFLGDLVIKLRHPDGVTTATIVNRPGSGAFEGDDIIQAVFDSQASATMVTSGAGPITGRVRPAVITDLNKFTGKPISGTWTLIVEDWYAGDIGAVRRIGVDSPQQSCGRSQLPLPTTGGASVITHEGATVTGTVDPNGLATGMRIAYGTTSAYGSVTGVADAGAGIGAQPFGAVLTGLAPGTTYHYRIEATRAGNVGVVGGNDMTFTTAPAPVASSTSVGPVQVIGASKVGTLGGADKVAPKFVGKVIPVILPLAKGKAPVKLRFRLDEAATVKLVIQKSTTGVRVGKKCLAKKRGRTGKACVLLVRYGTATQKLKSGGTTMNLVGGLKPGSYVITMTAVDAAKNTSKPTVVKLTVKAPPKK